MGALWPMDAYVPYGEKVVGLNSRQSRKLKEKHSMMAPNSNLMLFYVFVDATNNEIENSFSRTR